MAIVCIPLLLGIRLLGLPAASAADINPVVHAEVPADRGAFIELTALQMLAGLSYTAVYFFIVPYLLEAGYPSPFATAVFGAIGLASVAGFFINGLLADRFGARTVLLAGLLVCAISTPLLLLARSAFDHLAIVLFVLAWGATFNISSQLAPMLLLERLGTKRFGELFGFTNFFAGLASALGPLITAFFHDHLSGYSAAFVMSAAVMALSTLPLALRPPAMADTCRGV
jgi:MFS family permease